MGTTTTTARLLTVTAVVADPDLRQAKRLLRLPARRTRPRRSTSTATASRPPSAARSGSSGRRSSPSARSCGSQWAAGRGSILRELQGDGGGRVTDIDDIDRAVAAISGADVGRAGLPRRPRRRRPRVDAGAAPPVPGPGQGRRWHRGPSPSSSRRTTGSFPASTLATKPADFPEAPEVMVTFDCGSLDRLGELAGPAEAAGELIVLDHHVSNDALRHDQRRRRRRRGHRGRGAPPGRASSGWPLNRDAALCLYTGLVTDTGRFQYANTTPEVFALAAGAVRRSICRSPT